MNTKFDELTKSLARSVTRRGALKKFGLGLAGMALARFGLNEAHAITNGQLDGNGHPNVGGFVWLKNIWSPDPPPVFIGTASLIHPRIVLTAGHGTRPTELAIADGTMTIDDLLISFASDASNPVTWHAISSVVTHPDFEQPPDANGNIPLTDVGVAILKEPVISLPLTPLPPEGFLDFLAASGQLHSGADRAGFIVVGYGAVLGDNPKDFPFPPDGLRRVAQSEFRSLHEQWLFLNQNPAQDLGGSGSGDSGGPTLWIDPASGEETLVAITSRGNQSFGNKYRVDTHEALDFLNDVITRVDAGEL
jgi:hypothetical protein